MPDTPEVCPTSLPKSGCHNADVYYSEEADNYYCSFCRVGQGEEFHAIARNKDAVKLMRKLQDDIATLTARIAELETALRPTELPLPDSEGCWWECSGKEWQRRDIIRVGNTLHVRYTGNPHPGHWVKVVPPLPPSEAQHG